MIDETINTINKGDIIKSSLWSEIVEVKLVEQTGNYIYLMGIITISHTTVDQLIP